MYSDSWKLPAHQVEHDHKERVMNRRTPIRHMPVFLISLFSILVIVAQSGCFPSGHPKYTLESAARATLHALTTSQEAYKSAYGTYGTFDELRDAQYLAMEFTPDSMIEQYTLTWEIFPAEETEPAPDETSDGEESADDDAQSEDVQEEDAQDEGFEDRIETTVVYDRFTIIAMPEENRLSLRTFAITEDFILRVYNSDDGNDPEDVKTWNPVQ